MNYWWICVALKGTASTRPRVPGFGRRLRWAFVLAGSAFSVAGWGAVFDYSSPLPNLSAQYAGGAVTLRVVDGQGILRSTNVPSGPTTDLTTADGVAAWSSGSTIYSYTYDPLGTNFPGTLASVGATFDLQTAQGLVAWSSGSTVYYRVYDRLRTSWRVGSVISGTAFGITLADGMVAWSTSGAVFYRVYDVTKGSWNEGSGPGPTSDLINANGVVVWSSGGAVNFVVYDPTRTGWRAGSQAGSTFDLRNTNGVIAWSVNPNVYVAVYDPLRGQWVGNILNTGYTTDLAIHLSTVTWSTTGGNFIQGYNPSAGAWQANSALPLAYFTASATASNAPYSVAFVDMSIGANGWSWNFGDGLGTSTQRSPVYRYTTFGRYTATLTVGSSTTNRVILTDLIPPVGTNRINGGAAFTTNPAVTLTLSATDNSGVVSDQRLSNDSLNWTAWEPYTTTRAWTLAPSNGLKTVYAQFRDAAGNTSATATASIQLDTTPPPTVRFMSTNVTEGVGTATVLVTLDHPLMQPVSVRYATGDGTATAGADYISTNGLLVFPAGITNASLTVTILQDTAVELNETFTLNVTDATNALAGPAGIVTILDDDLATVSFATTNFSAIEGSGSATITLRLSAPSGRTVSVHFGTGTDGTATPGTDFVATQGVAVFPSGQTNATFSVTLIDDTLDELSETVPLFIDAVTNALPGAPQTAVLTILDDDNPVVNFSRSVYEVFENTNVVGLDVWLSKPFPQDVRVNYSILGGTATAGTDYLALSGTISFLPGETNVTLYVTLINDTIPEDDETVHVRLLSVAGGTLGPRSEADVLVLDDDRPPRFVTLQLDPDRHIRATVRGPAGQKFRVEFSLDLQQWSPLLTLTNVTGILEFTDPAPASSAQKFYRTALP